jgi:arylsulfatase A
VRGLGSTLDLLPTFCALAGVEAPTDRVLDGYDLGPVIRGEGESPRQEMLYYRGRVLFAARVGAFKAHFFTQSGYGGEPPVPHDPPLLYNLEADPSERFDVAERHPGALERIRERVEMHLSGVEETPDLLAIRLEP